MNPPSKRHELRLNRDGIKLIAGVDEVGIGPLAGPVVSAAVILKERTKLPGLDDSKKLSAKQRNILFKHIIDNSICIGVGIIDNAEIDTINILQASLKAMRTAVNSMSVMPDHVLVDGIRKIPGISIPQTAIKHGDAISSSLAAASVIAKVIRDSLMDRYDELYPNYGFGEHRGYGTKLHMKMLMKHGPSAIHRMSYEPVSRALKKKGVLFF
jgi:ribonuclease HII